MLTDKEIRDKWLEVTQRHRNGCVISSVEMAIELARWVEETERRECLFLLETTLQTARNASIEESRQSTGAITIKHAKLLAIADTLEQLCSAIRGRDKASPRAF